MRPGAVACAAMVGVRRTALMRGYTPTCVAPAGTVAVPGAATPASLRRSISRRMSFIGSYERTSGTTSKLLTGGGSS